MRILTLALVASFAFAGSDPSVAQAVGARASVKLVSSNGQMTQTSDTAWTLSKTGTVDTASSTVTWQATATQGPTTAGLLIVNGVLQVQNTGALGATIGNILVNLQTRQGNHWVTASTNVADATNDDAATSANISPTASSEGVGTFTENAASGQLLLMDASTNSLFALVPQQTIAPGATVNLLLSATFNNNVLGLTDGQPTRAEIIVSFGNSQSAGNATSPNIDISGNGVIDPDEDWVRSVPSRLGFNVPAQLPSNADVVLTDTEDDITTTGTVTFSNPVIVLGPTSGTVTVTYSGGTDGGTITNCAHLTGEGQSATSGGFNFPNVASLDLEACDTQIIGAQTCTPGTPGCGWQDGQLITHTQSAWGDPAHPAGILLSAQYNSVYGSVGGVLLVGIPGASGFSMLFTSATAVLNYQPSVGTVGPLNADLANPTSTSSGAFGGEVVALKLNIDFADAGHTLGTLATPRFGDLTLCNFIGTAAVLNNTSIRDFLTMANTALGGEATPIPLLDIHLITQGVNFAFNSGNVSLFAQQHLCRPTWQDGQFITFTQTDWGDPAHPAGQLLSAQYNFVYAATGGVLEVGISGGAGFSIVFTSATAILGYQPSVGAVGPLNADLVDPTSTSSGAFGGEVVALELNVDFADAGHTLGTTGLRFGDLTLCNFTTFTVLNGMSVRDFVAIANTGLGGGGTPLSVADLHTVSQQLNSSFGGGAASLFAQQHLVNSACGWKDGDLITYTQVAWGDPAHPAGQLLSAQYDFVYASTGGILEVGISGAAGFSMLFTNAVAILAYQPSVGTVGPLTADLLNPMSTSSGAFGSEVVSLTLNVDFADAGHTLGSTGLLFGDLTLCNFATFTVLNGMSVRGFVQMANTALGGGATPIPLVDIHAISEQVNAAFSNSNPSLFAQQQLFNGACPP